MVVQLQLLGIGLVESTAADLVSGIVLVIPRLIAGAIFLAMAYIGIRAVQMLVRRVVRRTLPPDQELVANLSVLVVGLFLWFAAILALLKIVGMGDVAASLGTAAGFVALGVAYALSNMIADTVAGVYLLRDPDFEPGDTVQAEGVTGEVRDIGIRKSRLQTSEGDVVVLANRDVDKKWTWKRSSSES